jgi:uncharacterized protein (TIGR02118 family)
MFDRAALSRRIILASVAVGAIRVLGRARAVPAAAEDASPVASPAALGPARLIALFAAPTDEAAFERYFVETHVPLARTIPGLQQVESSPIVGAPAGEIPPYYRIAHLVFASMTDLQGGVASPEGQATVADLSNFATGGVTLLRAQDDAP